jgi:hypothetical protein
MSGPLTGWGRSANPFARLLLAPFEAWDRREQAAFIQREIEREKLEKLQAQRTGGDSEAQIAACPAPTSGVDMNLGNRG